MKSSALVFLAAFVALSASFGGFVLAPQLQLGRSAPSKILASEELYPVARPGLAKQGAEVYRSLGCVYCHSQQVGQERTVCEVILTDAGTNQAATLAMLAKLNPALAGANGEKILQALPATVLQVISSDAAGPAVNELKIVGAKAESRVSQQGPDLARGWGRRATVAQDFLYDDPVQPGTRRIGPDLANISLRQADLNWHLQHLYRPQSTVPNSTMPPYRFLFETRKVTGRPSADALPAEFAPVGKNGERYEIVPKESARALAAYLVSLRADVPLFETPYSPPASAVASTNSPAK